MESSAALEQGYKTSHRVYELCGMAATVLTGAWLGRRLVTSHAVSPWWLPVAMAIGMLGADLLSGLVHWGFDTWGSVDTPVLGKLAIRTFRQHHIDPKAMLHHDFVETNGHNFALALTLTAGGLCVVPVHDASQRSLFAGLCMLAMALFVSVTSQIHKWAHMDEPPRWVRPLQRMRLLLSPSHHQKHHDAPHDSHYCITVGWLDELLLHTGSFRSVEAAIQRATGIKPSRHS
jgi:hypothetical protein